MDTAPMAHSARTSPLDKPVIRLALAGLTLLAFYLIYKFVLEPERNFLRAYTHALTQFSAALLHLFGYNVGVILPPASSAGFLTINTVPCVEVATSCNGFNLLGVYAVVLFLFRGKISTKLIFLVGGGLIIYFVNALRIAALALHYHYAPESADFNHKYTYTLIIYAIIFLIWHTYIKRFSGRNPVSPLIA